MKNEYFVYLTPQPPLHLERGIALKRSKLMKTHLSKWRGGEVF
jgi:hypothetical protein